MKLMKTLLLTGNQSSPAATALGLGIFRIGFGLMLFFAHGLPKLLNFSTKSAGFSDPLGVGSPLSLGLTIFAEAVCAVLVALGLFTRLSVIPILIAMVVIVFMVHAGDPFPRKELAVFYGLGALSLLVGGGGSLSVGNLFRR